MEQVFATITVILSSYVTYALLAWAVSPKSPRTFVVYTLAVVAMMSSTVVTVVGVRWLISTGIS